MTTNSEGKQKRSKMRRATECLTFGRKMSHTKKRAQVTTRRAFAVSFFFFFPLSFLPSSFCNISLFGIRQGKERILHGNLRLILYQDLGRGQASRLLFLSKSNKLARGTAVHHLLQKVYNCSSPHTSHLQSHQVHIGAVAACRVLKLLLRAHADEIA